ncbi:single-stranded-DNA-specific exonuclease RecJ [Cereibacter sphaeroides]|uniref:single-stranded-DNA-specific exonuclease RecJ n=1 Tax=Cereibacter sphaeroides TaxID=1063 RepID=UPI001F30D4D3|nr:single-stranded-DNA-specific exonuclease RecJ [Cereibacter sphaeroides]MCE6957718.1 single-stranded-DNA-specific exonuclease RecJ [Cereibacter sphaeroides]MCE6971504.1 single-stranded-DNA-specific exonuclease RecJ [Cereibacter sphaeroides]
MPEVTQLSQADTGLSFRGRAWAVRDAEAGAIRGLKATGCTDDLARILASRGVTATGLAAFQEPKIRDLMPDPYFLRDMEPATKRLAQAIRNRERIGIWSDYDCDGATSAGILGRFLRMCGHPDFLLRIPDRIHEGYGPNTPGLLGMQADGCGLICILDAGTVAFEPLEAAAAAGIDVIVLDHHGAKDTVPPAVAVVNPNRKDQKPGLGHLCAAGVTFVATVAVTRELRDSGYFDGRDGRPADVPELMQLLDLVALGTVCDVVPLVGLNRAFVARGLPWLSRRITPGIRALARVAGIDPDAPIDETACGWVLGPRLNAGGRIGTSTMAALLLLEEDPVRAEARAEELDQLNTRRKEIEAAATEAAIAQLGGRVPGVDRTLAIAVVSAHEGVVGISAARLKEAFDAPAIVLTEAEHGLLKGSARSLPGFDIGHAILSAHQAGLVEKGGGHGMAGGVTLRPDQLQAFTAFMNAEIAKTAYWREGLRSEADIALPLGRLTVPFIESLDRLRPFGTANTEPVVLLQDVVLSEIRILKEKHFKIVARNGSDEIDAMLWNVAGTALGEKIQAAKGRRIDILGKPQVNEFMRKKRPQVIVDDLRFAPGALL